MPTTEENLQTAFAGESQANRKYLAFATRADKDGLPNVAKLFRAAAEAETLHAHGHLRALDGVKTTLENLEAAVAGETYEFTEMYPPMLAQAEAEGHKAKRMFRMALETEKVHAELYTKALESVKSGKDLDVEAYLCPVCGHIEFGKPGQKCPVCGAAPEKYLKID
ncbi:Rubrerythrin-like protein DVU2318 [hydrothermal vent metagenome]|uniref:Rubrerythrin-like protein DVU2318 n=1 Tax=hydrothermal vent metagenome TaxID=652676 RepID=A0A3B1BUX0_9ZZZZ